MVIWFRVLVKKKLDGSYKQWIVSHCLYEAWGNKKYGRPIRTAQVRPSLVHLFLPRLLQNCASCSTKSILAVANASRYLSIAVVNVVNQSDIIFE